MTYLFYLKRGLFFAVILGDMVCCAHVFFHFIDLIAIAVVTLEFSAIWTISFSKWKAMT